MKTGEIKMSLQTLFELKSKCDADIDLMNKLHDQSMHDQAVIANLKIEKEKLEKKLADAGKFNLNPYHYVIEHPNLKHMLPDYVSDIYFNDAFDSFLMSFKNTPKKESAAVAVTDIDVNDYYTVIDAEFGVSYGVKNGDLFFKSTKSNSYVQPKLRIEFSTEYILDFVKKGYLRKD